MNKNTQRQIDVYADWVGLPEPTRMGVLYASLQRGKEIFSFEYAPEWLSSNQVHALDPSLQLFPGQQYAPGGKNNFAIFLDSSPDRWGRFLMKRREAQASRDEERNEHKLLESDYLLGVYDEHRMGALRFKTEPDGPFLDHNRDYAAPPWASLREIENASLAIEKDDVENNPQQKKWLKMLIAPGGSLGGARPKASVVDENNHPWIAKFPSRYDDDDIGAWEMVVYKLAERAQVTTTQARIEKYNSRFHTFLSKRFDRTDIGGRIHFASALTLLQRSDGDDASNGASYLELAEFIIQQGARPQQDLEQLWRRIVFYICVSNTDDHLRNHGFILSPPHGWILSPAFDINPDANGDGLKLNISDTDNSQDLSLASDVADIFRINKDKANNIITEVVSVVKQWRDEAALLGLSASAQDRMARAFRVAESYSL